MCVCVCVCECEFAENNSLQILATAVARNCAVKLHVTAFYVVLSYQLNQEGLT